MPFNPDNFPGLNKSRCKNALFLFSRQGSRTCRLIPAWEQINLVYLLGESVFPLFGLRESKTQNHDPVFLMRIVYLSPSVSEYLDHLSPSVPNSHRLVQRTPTASYLLKILHSSLVVPVNPARVHSAPYSLKILHSSSVVSVSFASIHFGTLHL